MLLALFITSRRFAVVEPSLDEIKMNRNSEFWWKKLGILVTISRLRASFAQEIEIPANVAATDSAQLGIDRPADSLECSQKRFCDEFVSLRDLKSPLQSRHIRLKTKMSFVKGR